MLWPRKIYAPFLQASELRSAAGKVYEAACHRFLVGQSENSRNLQWYERQTTDYNTDSTMGHLPPQRVPWAESKSTILPRELPTDSRKASDALAAYAKELPEDGIHYIRPLNPNQATWDALILQKGKSNLAVFSYKCRTVKTTKSTTKASNLFEKPFRISNQISHMSLSFTPVKINN